jgi:hypothetical protein
MLLALILLGISHPALFALAGESKVILSQGTQTNTQPYVAVIGQIGRPGVFELAGPLPQLAEFLNSAGGITPNASGSIRVIRRGRSSQYFLSPKLSLQLIPDDLIVVESKQFVAGRQAGNTASANGWQPNADALSAVPAPAVVQIGLVNLISRPVVLDIPSEQANVAQVLSLLHQPVTEKGQITVIKPGSGVQSVSLEQAFEATLATGTVLVFDPATVISGVLPRLPKTIRADADFDVAIAKTSAETATQPKTILANGPTIQPEPVANPSLPVPRVISPDTTASGSASLKPEVAEPSPARSPTEETEPSTADVGTSSESPDLQALPDTAADQSTDAEPAAPIAEAAFSSSWLIMLTAIAACCLGMAWWSRSKRKPQPVAALTLPEPVQPQENSLELLISGALPIVEEPLQLPYESEIFGRPLDNDPNRTDPAQALSGPHYAPQPISLPIAQPGPAATETVVVPESVQDSPTVAADWQMRVDVRHPRSTASVLDRALATFEGEQA